MTKSLTHLLRRAALVGTALVALSVAAVAPHRAEAEPRRGGTATYAYISGPGTLDPHVASSMVELEVIHHLFETLVAMDVDGAKARDKSGAVDDGGKSASTAKNGKEGK